MAIEESVMRSLLTASLVALAVALFFSVGGTNLQLFHASIFALVLGVAFFLFPLARMLAGAANPHTTHSAEQKREEFARRQKIYHAAHMVNESRKAVERFFHENPTETCSTFQGKAMLAHHLGKYEEYLVALGMDRDAASRYHDSYWAQLKELATHGGELRKLPSIPPMSDGRHRVLYDAM